MTRDDWCRRTSWSEQDAREFHERNRRSRGDDSKAQYLQIQAEALLGTEKQELLESALELAELAINQYPGTVTYARALDCAGRCCERLGRADEAIKYFLQALERESEFPGVGTNACFHLGRVVVNEAREDVFDTVRGALDDFGAPVFPWHAYMMSGVKARILAQRGALEEAALLARAALKAASVSDSGLGWGRESVGLVSDTDSQFHKELLKLAAA